MKLVLSIWHLADCACWALARLGITLGLLSALAMAVTGGQATTSDWGLVAGAFLLALFASVTKEVARGLAHRLMRRIIGL